MKKRFILVGTIIFVLGAAASLSYFLWNNYARTKEEQARLEKRRGAWNNLQGEIKRQLNAFDGKAGIVIKDLKTGWQININEEKTFPSASLAKVPIMVACFYAAGEGKLSLDEVMILRYKDMVLGSGILKTFPPGSRFSAQKLVEIMISRSDNTAANMLIDRLGFDYINGCFKKAALMDTNIARKMMDFKSRRKGIENFTTAKDIAVLLEDIYRDRAINKEYSKMCLDFLREQKINDRIPAKLPDDIMVAHKTGLERGICHDAGIIFTPEGDFLICILTRHKAKALKNAKRFIAQVSYLTYQYTNNRIPSSRKLAALRR